MLHCCLFDVTPTPLAALSVAVIITLAMSWSLVVADPSQLSLHLPVETHCPAVHSSHIEHHFRGSKKSKLAPTGMKKSIPSRQGSSKVMTKTGNLSSILPMPMFTITGPQIVTH
ncbi:hypothetical protein E2C01_051026 [Portunus trituberculatus]|uniref:Uncharacterized protein n=1 Tax=Portunus trituberculatus TaxID=210409 RepID=A0A5B7GI21_PORTR|nr:hypothetical protein [Portunus trituberculatus]